MKTTAKSLVTIYIPSVDMDIFKTIAKKFGWKMSIESQKAAKSKTAFQKSQEDITAGRINTYKNSDELFEKLF